MSAIIPLHETKLPEKQGVFKCKTVKLSGDREIMVGYSEEDGSKLIRIRRPEPDGNICETQFGLTEDAAHALYDLLTQTFKSQYDQAQLPSDSNGV